MKYFRVGLPFLVLFLCVCNFVLAFYDNNSMAMAGYITAFFGWVAISYDEWMQFRLNKGV